MTKIEDFATAATTKNHEVALRALDAIETETRHLRYSLTYGLRALGRVQFFKNIQHATAMAIAADGRQTMVEDLRTNAAQLKEATSATELAQAVRDAVAETLADFDLPRYSEEDNDDTDDGLDDPPACDARPWWKAPVTTPPAQAAKISNFGVQLLPPEPSPEQRKQLQDFFSGLRIV